MKMQNQFRVLLFLSCVLALPFFKHSGSTVSAQAANTWTQKANFGGVARNGVTAFSIGNKGYMGNGVNSSGANLNDFWEYDPTTNAWTQKANFAGTARRWASGFSIGTKGYVCGGYDGTYKNDFYEFDPASNVWTAKASFTGTRQGASAFSIGTKGYMGLGYNGTNYSDFYEYDPSLNTWTAKANFAGTARQGAAGFAIGSMGYVGTGYGGATFLSDFWAYDPGANTWTSKASVPVARNTAVGFCIGSKGYIGCGHNGSAFLNDFYEYDVNANAWTAKATVGGGARGSGPGGFAIGTKGYIGAGSNGTPLNDFWEYASASPAAALNFDGSNDYVNCGTNPVLNLTSSLSIEAWVNRSSVTNSQCIVGKDIFSANTGYSFWIYNDNKFLLRFGNIIFPSTTTLGTGTWNHLAATYSGGTVKLYLNGVLDGTYTGVANPVTNSVGMYLGTPADAVGNVTFGFNGSMDEVRVWNVARTQCEINTYKNCEIATSATGLVANYHFNQGFNGANNPTETTLTDLSGNSNNGTLTNFALTGTTSNWVAPGGVISGSVTPLAAPTVSSTVTNSVICNGGSTTLNGTGASTYTWTGGVTNGVSFSPTSTTAYTVTGTAAASGCTNSAVNTVAVNPLPVISVNSGAICNGQSFTMVPSGANTYTYSSGSAVVTPAVPTAYSVSGTSTAGCVSSVAATSNVTVNNCPVGAALSFDGTDDYVPIATYANIPTGNSNYTFEAWINPGTTAGRYGIIGLGNYGTGNTVNALRTGDVAEGSGLVNYWWGNDMNVTQTDIGFSIYDGNWHHIALVYDGSNKKCYVDGSLKKTFAASGANVSAINLAIGKTAGVEYFKGQMDEVRIWNIARTNCEINMYKNCEISTTAVGLAGNYQFNQGYATGTNTITTLTDASGNSNTGTLNNFALTGTTSNWVAPGAVTSGSTTPAALLPNVGSTVTNSVICNGGSTTLNGTGASTYTWTGVVTNGVSFSPTTTTAYTVIGTSAAYGCTNTAVNTVTVNPLPTAGIAGTNTICAGQTPL